MGETKKLEKLLDFLSCVLVAVSEICIHIFNSLKCWLIINKRNERKLLYLKCKWMRMYSMSARGACLRYQCILKQNENNTKSIWIDLFQKTIQVYSTIIYTKVIFLQISYVKPITTKFYVIIDVPNFSNVEIPLTTGFQWRCYDFGINNFFYINHVAKPIL